MYYLKYNGEEHGPFSADQVRQESGSTTLVSFNDKWLPLSDHPDFRGKETGPISTGAIGAIWLFGWVSSIGLHLWVTLIGLTKAGFLGGVLTFCLPGFSTFYWAYKLWSLKDPSFGILACVLGAVIAAKLLSFVVLLGGEQ